jgi:hypothetical protein
MCVHCLIHIPTNFSVFLALSCISFKVSGLILRYLIYFGLILVQGDKHGCSFSFLQADIQFSQCFLKRLSFFLSMFLALCQKSSRCCCGFLSGSSILFRWSSYLFLCHAVLIAMTVVYFEVGYCDVSSVALFAQYCINYLKSFVLPYEIYSCFSIFVMNGIRILMGFIEHVDCFW